MTTKNTTMALAELAEKGADLDLLREMIQFVVQRLMDMDVETLCGAGYGERTAKKALAAVIQEAYIQGVSMRSVGELVKPFGMTGACKEFCVCEPYHELLDWRQVWQRSTTMGFRGNCSMS